MPTAAPTKERQWAPLRPRRRPQTGASAQAFAAYVFCSGYVLLLLVFGVLPMVYALYLSFTKSGQFVGLDNYVKAVGDFRFLPAVQHVAAFLVIWVVTLTVLVTLLALIVHAVRVRRRFPLPRSSCSSSPAHSRVRPASCSGSSCSIPRSARCPSS